MTNTLVFSDDKKRTILIKCKTKGAYNFLMGLIYGNCKLKWEIERK